MMNFVDKRKQQMGIKSLGDRIRSGEVRRNKDPETYINGPKEFDCLQDRWAAGEVLGLIGPSGSGKTEIVLNWFKGMLENNDDDSIVIFVSLEMTTQRIANRWFKLVGEDSKLADRFYVVSNFTDDDKAKGLTTGGILREMKDIKNTIGTKVLCFAIDHLHIIESTAGETNNKKCQKIKDMAVEMSSFAILLSQTTKAKTAGFGDIPLDADASYDCSQFKWIASYIVTIHQPLARVPESGLHILSWGYFKVRERHKDDRVKVGANNLLVYNMENGELTRPTRNNKKEFSMWYEKVQELREAEEKNKSYHYDLVDDVRAPNGSMISMKDGPGFK